MKTSLHRRALISGALALPLASVGASSAAGHPDAALLALQAEIDAADLAWEALFREKCAAEERYLALEPAKPEEPGAPKSVMDAFWSGVSRPLIEASKAPDTDYQKALKAWRAAKDELERETGFTAADEAANAAERVRLAIRDTIIITRARTLEGLIFKARYAASHFDGDPVMLSIVDDLLALKGEPDSSSLDGRPSGAPDVDA